MFIFKEEVLQHGNIEIIACGDFLDIVLLEEGNELTRLTLSKWTPFFTGGVKSDIYIDDLLGIRGKGYGTIAMNEAIKYLQVNCDSNLIVGSIVSDVSDQDLEENLRNELSLKRRQFFQKFNFKIECGDRSNYDKISSKIGDLKIAENS